MYCILLGITTHLAKTHGRFGWKDKPFTRADFVSNFVNIMIFINNGEIGVFTTSSIYNPTNIWHYVMWTRHEDVFFFPWLISKHHSHNKFPKFQDKRHRSCLFKKWIGFSSKNTLFHIVLFHNSLIHFSIWI